jgi:hypothetical protein
VRRLEISLKAEFVEFCLRVKEGKVKIFLETLIPQKQTSSTFHRNRETDLRLINFLMPPSGLEKAFSGKSTSTKRGGSYERKPSLFGLLRQRDSGQYTDGSGYEDRSSSRASSGEEREISNASYAKSSSLYKKHMEELNLSGYIEE